ncbi:MAG TPA: hypothetical protein ENF44_04505 [Deltaproteobacteria bacterium]|nr:hypothetical protein [Deltaproteobacteria bacterium]
MCDLILKVKGEITMLIAEQNARFAVAVSDRGYIIEKGRIAYEGTSAELAADEGVKEKYLAV